MAFTLQLGENAPDFDLSGVDGRFYSLQDFADFPILVIVFSCVHCPYVVGSEERMIGFHQDYESRGVAFVAINSNAQTTYADDSFQGMQARAAERDFQFPFLHDESQQIALDYGALKTPHYFVFDPERKLRYTGRMDDNPRNPGLETTRELRDAVDALLENRAIEVALTNPIGCNVKWAGKEKHWMPAQACDIV